MLRPLAFASAIAVFAPSPAPAAAWEAGDVEAAERYRALERERALRYRAALEERADARREPAPRRASAREARPQREERARPRRAEDRPAAVFEPWVEELAARLWDAVFEALSSAASDAWHELRAWLEASLTWPGRDHGRAQGDWRSRR